MSLAIVSSLDPGRMLLSGGVTPGRAVLGDDPALGLAQPPAPPVLLLEPVETFMAVDPLGRSRELQTELLIQQGFQRYDEDTVQPLPGWTVRRTASQLQVRDDHGELWAHTYVRPGRRWLETAAAHGQVLVVYGTLIGVRAPRGVPTVQYAASHRAAELQTGRAKGLVAAAVLSWQP
jgi:hypothetical protein